MTANTSPDFQRLLKEYRSRAVLTQEELAERAEISTRSISDLERGVSCQPRPDTIRRLAGALDLAGAELEEFKVAARGSLAFTYRGGGRNGSEPQKAVQANAYLAIGNEHHPTRVTIAAPYKVGVPTAPMRAERTVIVVVRERFNRPGIALAVIGGAALLAGGAMWLAAALARSDANHARRLYYSIQAS